MKTQAKTGLYIHIPFCSRKCFFCSFVVCVGKTHYIDAYLECLSTEMKKYSGKEIDTVYVGGGTPTLLSEPQLQRLHKIIFENFKIARNCEYTIETNPDTIDLSKAKLLRALGVNRMSLGAQSFNDGYLKFLGRTHSSRDIKKCFEILRKAGFSNINIDLMFGFPGQSLSQLRKDLHAAVKLKSEHLSIYNLTIEKNSRFNLRKLSLPNSDACGKFYCAIIEYLEKNGLKQYEISNFARPNKESAHNCLYWQRQDYIGLGLGAHSHLGNKNFWNISKLHSYLMSIQGGQSAVEGSEALEDEAQLIEALLFGLRMNKGVPLGALQKKIDCVIPLNKKKKIKEFINNGFLELKENTLRTTLKGRLVLDELCGYLI